MPERRRIIVAPRPQIVACLGIDPGVSGGLVIVENHPSPIVLYTTMPESDLDLWNWLERSARPANIAVIENVTASPQMGSVSSFTFGCGYGRLRMALTAMGISYTEVRPTVWQRALQIPKTRKPERQDEVREDGMVRTQQAIKARLQKEHKEIIRQRAQQLFPELDLWQKTKTEQLSICDALLLAHYGVMTRGGFQDEQVRGSNAVSTGEEG